MLVLNVQYTFVKGTVHSEKLDDFDYKVALQQKMVAAQSSGVLRPLQIGTTSPTSQNQNQNPEGGVVKPSVMTSASSTGSAASTTTTTNEMKPLTIGPIAPNDRSTSSESEGPRRLHVSNIPFKYREPDLKGMFERFGPVVDVEIIFNERGSKGFGFVTMQSPEDADRARNEINGSTIEGRRVEVNMATQRVHTKKAKPLMSVGVVDPIAAQNLLVVQQQQQQQQFRNALIQQQLLAQQLLMPRQQQLMMPPTSAHAAINLQALQYQQLIMAQQQQQQQQLQQNPQFLLQLQQQQQAAVQAAAAAAAQQQQQQVPTSMAHHQMIQHHQQQVAAMAMDPMAHAQAAQMATMIAYEQQRMQLQAVQAQAAAAQGRAVQQHQASAAAAAAAAAAGRGIPPPPSNQQQAPAVAGSIGEQYLQQSLSGAASLHQHHNLHQASAAAAALQRRFAPY
ncbi:CRE-ASD-1 protein [Caenorhabditis remanei]|uniref:CRE-ASD-1 protein n=1 Tax=Caenorhabditis remanei TaxID=31234 RepID=E3N6N4_CAERE|nr:CRE-ASD-1 protein [Caenorhabditis remanei]